MMPSGRRRHWIRRNGRNEKPDGYVIQTCRIERIEFTLPKHYFLSILRLSLNCFGTAIQNDRFLQVCTCLEEMEEVAFAHCYGLVEGKGRTKDDQRSLLF